MKEKYDQLLDQLQRRSKQAREYSKTTKYDVVKNRRQAAANAYDDAAALIKYYLEEFANPPENRAKTK